APAVRGVPLAMIEALIGHCLERVHAHGRALPICDIVELNPHVDQQTMTARTAAYLARQLLTG
ncbi:MAG: arginase family protein, partial [Pseudomonadota bacterium]